ncbi:hypothetical protein [Puniceibacterium antarcticum]|uniref:hypothetical protein n=1 Tax=Puniceibacterium antarcticum TaxID=1206336 RepID=UPI001FE75BC7|nr:hypothetical protein [Puniceibacterium antarcticum]
MTQTLERIANQWPSAELYALMLWKHNPSTATPSRLLRLRGMPNLTVPMKPCMPHGTFHAPQLYQM